MHTRPAPQRRSRSFRGWRRNRYRNQRPVSNAMGATISPHGMAKITGCCPRKHPARGLKHDAGRYLHRRPFPARHNPLGRPHLVRTILASERSSDTKRPRREASTCVSSPVVTRRIPAPAAPQVAVVKLSFRSIRRALRSPGMRVRCLMGVPICNSDVFAP